MPHVDLSTYTPGDYSPGPLWKRCWWLACSRLFFETHFPWPSRLKGSLLRWFGATVGEWAVIKPNVKIKYPWFLELGDHCWIGEQVWIDNLARVTLSDHVVLSQGAYLLTGNHDYRSTTFDLMIRPLQIETGAWIAARAIVCPGITVAENAILSVASVATQDLDADGVYSGNPAVRVRERWR